MIIKKGDLVAILAGRDKGKSGTIEKAFSATGKIIIQGININKKHLKKTNSNPTSGIIDKILPIDSSNVGIICPQCKKITRIGKKITNHEKIRICLKCNEVI